MAQAPPLLRLVSPSSTPTTETTEAPIEAPQITIDPGQVIRVNARFPGAPKRILFSFLPPKSEVATHDPGAGVLESKIEREGDDLYFYNIDTRGMHGGVGWWYFVSEDPDPKKRRAKVGQFVVRDVPRALIERTAPKTFFEAAANVPEESGLDLLGTLDPDVKDESTPTTVLIGLGIVAGAALLFS